jgi:hypothetical protein
VKGESIGAQTGSERQIINLIIRLLWELFKVHSLELSLDLISKVLKKSDLVLNFWRQIPTFSLLASSPCLTRPWCDIIERCIVKFWETQPSAIMIHDIASAIYRPFRS